MMEEKKIDELVYYIQKNDYERACECFEQNTDKLNANQRIVLCTRLFDKINNKNCECFISMVCKCFSVNNIRKIFGNLEQNEIEKIRENIFFEQLVDRLYKCELENKMSIIMESLDCEKEIFSLIPEDKIDKLLLSMNTEQYMDKYIYRKIGNYKDEEFLDFLSSECKINARYKFKKYKKILVDNLSLQDKVENLIFDLLDKSNEVSISMKTIISHVLGLGEDKLEFVKRLINRYSTQQYDLNKEINRSSGCTEAITIIYTLAQKNYSLHTIIYLFMNTKLRFQITLDRLVDKLTHLGYYEEKIINEINDNYWISGKIKYIEVKGNVRVCPMSVASSRLMTFNINYQNVDTQYVIGDIIYYKIYCYFSDGKKFVVNHVRTNIQNVEV